MTTAKNRDPLDEQNYPQDSEDLFALSCSWALYSTTLRPYTWHISVKNYSSQAILTLCRISRHISIKTYEVPGRYYRRSSHVEQLYQQDTSCHWWAFTLLEPQSR